MGIQTVDEIPDEKTVWATREKLSEAGTFDQLFSDFRKFLDEKDFRSTRAKLLMPPLLKLPNSAIPKKRTSKSRKAKARIFGIQRMGTTKRNKRARRQRSLIRTSMLVGPRNAVKITMVTRIM